MLITEFERDNRILKDQLADLLAKTWPNDYGQTAKNEVEKLLAPERIAVAALVDDDLVGFVGAIPQYGQTGWEMHPLVVVADFRRQKIGARLVSFLESEIASRGGITIYLGTDDENDETTLSQVNLYNEPLEAIANIKNLKAHPYSFYEKLGYQITGVIPDANGWFKPDIIMSKRIGDFEELTEDE